VYVDPGPAWTSGSFDDSAWRYGTGPFAHLPGPAHVCFRKQLSLSRGVSSARLEVVCDDGVALWVNGRLVAARNGGSTAHTALATGRAENTGFNVELADASAFVAGRTPSQSG
jgi:hypothetical protein